MFVCLEMDTIEYMFTYGRENGKPVNTKSLSKFKLIFVCMTMCM